MAAIPKFVYKGIRLNSGLNNTPNINSMQCISISNIEYGNIFLKIDDDLWWAVMLKLFGSDTVNSIPKCSYITNAY